MRSKVVRSLVGKEGLQMMCLQETKNDVIEKKFCQGLWEENDV